MPNQPSSIVPRPTEYERLVSDLTDQRVFSPVAITSVLDGARGMGKTTLAREVCRDARVVDAFLDGIIWVTLGANLSPLQLISRIERLIYDLAGEQRGLTSLAAAEAHLSDLLQRRRVLLVLDEACDRESVRSFLQTGPGGRVLIISRGDAALPDDARRTAVDIMDPEEAALLLAGGLTRFETQAVETGQELSPQAPAGAEEDLSETAAPVQRDPLLAGLGYLDAPLETAPGAVVGAAERVVRAWGGDVSLESARLLVDLAGRLNEWPMLLGLVNGYMRACLEQHDCPDLPSAVRRALDDLSANGLPEAWPATDTLQRDAAAWAVLTTCLAPLHGAIHQRFLDLVVFPPDEDIPLAAVSALWRTSSEDTYTAAQILARRSLVYLDPQGRALRLPPMLRAAIGDHLRLGVPTDLHRSMVAGYGARCRYHPADIGPTGWISGPDDGYFFQHLGAHLAGAGQLEELQDLLLQFDWLYKYLTCTNLLTGQRGDLYSLLMDFEMALAAPLERQSAELRLVAETLRLSAAIIIRDPGQLPAQLLGRLAAFSEPKIQELLRQAETWHEEAWLRPITTCFRAPGQDEVRTLTGHTDWVTCVGIFPDGQSAVSGSLDGSLRWWDLASGRAAREVTAHMAGVSGLAVTQDGHKVITCGWDGRVCVWDASDGALLLEFAAHQGAVASLALTPDDTRLVTGADDRLIRVWELSSGKAVFELVGHGEPVRALAVSPDGRTLLSGSWDCTVRAWDLETGQQARFMPGHESWISAVGFSPDGNVAISTGWDQVVRTWDLSSGEPLRAVSGFNQAVLTFALLPERNRLLAGCGDGSLHLVDYESGEILFTRGAHAGGINHLAVTRQGQFALSASDDRTLRIWDLARLRATHPAPGHAGQVAALHGLAGSTRGISAALDGTLKIWDLVDGSEKAVLEGHSAGVVVLVVSEDGRLAVSGARDHTLKVWDLERACEIRTMPGHAGAITSVALTPDARYAVSGADDGTLRVWDLSSGALMSEFRGEGAVWACAWGRDGRTIIASGSTGKLYFLEFKPGLS